MTTSTELLEHFIENLQTIIDKHKKFRSYSLFKQSDWDEIFKCNDSKSVKQCLQIITVQMVDACSVQLSSALYCSCLFGIIMNPNSEYTKIAKDSPIFCELIKYKRFSDSYESFKLELQQIKLYNDFEQLIFQRFYESNISKLETILDIPNSQQNRPPDFNAIHESIQSLKNEIQEGLDLKLPLMEQISGDPTNHFYIEMNRILNQLSDYNSEIKWKERFSSFQMETDVTIAGRIFQAASFQMISALMAFQRVADDGPQKDMEIASDKASRIKNMTLVHCVAMNPDAMLIFRDFVTKEIISSEDLFKPTSSTGDLPYHVAAFYGNVACIEYIRTFDEKGEKLKTIKNIFGELPIHKAALGIDREALMFLHKEHDFDLKVLSKNSNLLFKNATQDQCNCLADVVDITGNNKHINDQDKNSYTALHYAAKLYQHELFVKLVQNGAHCSIPNDSGKTPIDLMKPGQLEKILDSCVQRDEKKNTIITNGIRSAENVRAIAECPEVEELCWSHPVPQILLKIKWSQVRKLFYLKMALHLALGVTTFIFAMKIESNVDAAVSKSIYYDYFFWIALIFAGLNILILTPSAFSNLIHNGEESWKVKCWKSNLTYPKIVLHGLKLVDWCELMLLINALSMVIYLFLPLPHSVVVFLAMFCIFYTTMSLSNTLIAFRYMLWVVARCSLPIWLAVVFVIEVAFRIYLNELIKETENGDKYGHKIVEWDGKEWSSMLYVLASGQIQIFSSEYLDKISAITIVLCVVFLLMAACFAIFAIRFTYRKVGEVLRRKMVVQVIQQCNIITKINTLLKILHMYNTNFLFHEKIRILPHDGQIQNLKKHEHETSSVENIAGEAENYWETNFPWLARKIWVNDTTDFVLCPTIDNSLDEIFNRTQNLYHDPKNNEIVYRIKKSDWEENKNQPSGSKGIISENENQPGGSNGIISENENQPSGSSVIHSENENNSETIQNGAIPKTSKPNYTSKLMKHLKKKYKKWHE